MNVRFMSLGSGSSGNCYYLAADEYSLLIDAGIGIRKIKKIFKDYALDLTSVCAILVTHDHADHIKAVGSLSEKYHIPVYATAGVHEGMRKSYCMTKKLGQDCIETIEKEKEFSIGNFRITCFEVPHDSVDNVGYRIAVDGKNFTFVTDIGHLTPTIARYVETANYLIMEANYDEGMLMSGSYPWHLKTRISGGNGHLSNAQLAEFLSEHFPPGLRYLWLCHLSLENNLPERVMQTLGEVLARKGIVVGRDIQALPLRRTIPSELYNL